MKTRAAVLRKGGEPWEITELDLDEPKAGEVLIRYEAAGLCHSDEHIRATGTARLPLVGGHEGAGVIEKTGPGVTRVQTGDRVACSYIPVCGTCRYCSTGHQNLCDAGKNAAIGCLVDGTFRFHDNHEDLGGMCVLGTFSQYAVHLRMVLREDRRRHPVRAGRAGQLRRDHRVLLLDPAADVRPGETVVIFGTGGVGINAVQGARYAGGKHVIAVDPVEFKREQAMEFGATHAFAGPEQAHEAVVELTRGQLADKVICTVGEMNNDVVQAAVNMTGKAGTIVITGVGYYDMVLPGGILIGYHRRMQGALFGGANPLYDIPMILGLWQAGDVKLTELVTRRYTLDQVNEGYQDMMDGKNLRGVIIHEH